MYNLLPAEISPGFATRLNTPLGLLPGDGLQVLLFVLNPLLAVAAIGSFCSRLLDAVTSTFYVVLLAQRPE